MSEQDNSAASKAVSNPVLSQLRLALTLVSLSVTIATIILPIYTAQLNLTGIELGGLLSAGAFAAALSRPIIGRATDQYGRKRFLLMGTALMVLATLVFALAHSTLLLFVASTLHGLSIGTLLVAAYAMTGDVASSAGRGSHFGLVEESQQRGGLIGIMVMGCVVVAMHFLNNNATFTISQSAWAVSFCIYAAVAALACWVIWFRVDETYQPSQPYPLIDRTANSATSALVLDKSLVTLLAVVFLTSASVYASQPILLKYISETITSDLQWVALAFAPSAILVSVLPSRMGRFADRYGRTLPMLLGLGANAVYAAMVPFIGTMGGLMVFAILESLCYSAAVPAEQALLTDLTHNDKRGAGFGMYTLVQTGGKVLGYLGMGALYDLTKHGPFFLNAAVLIVCMALVWFGLRKIEAARS